MSKDVILGDEINVLSGYPFDSKKFTNEPLGKQLIRIRDLQTFESDTNFSGEYDPLFIVTKGDILIGMDGDFHIVKWMGKDGLLNQRILKLLPKPQSKVDLGYIFYRLQPILLEINDKTAATTVKHLSTTDIKELPLKVPLLPIQQKIAKILSTIDGQIEKTEAIIAKYQAVKKGMLQDLFTPHKWKELNFELLSLSDIADIIPSNVDKKIYLSELPAFLCNYMDVYNNRYLTGKNKFSNGSVTATEVQKFKLRKGDVIITKDSETPDDIAIPSVVMEEIDDLVCGYHLALLRPIKGKVDSRFLMQLIQTEAVKRQFSIKANGSTRYGLTIDAIKSIKISIPNLEVQLRIAECLLTLDNKISTELSSMDKMISIKQGLMSDLLSGKVAVTV